MNYKQKLMLIFLGMSLQMHGCCLPLFKTVPTHAERHKIPKKRSFSETQKRIEDMVKRLTAGEIVLHQRNTTEEYKTYNFSEADINFLKTCIEERLKHDEALKENVNRITIIGNDQFRRASLGSKAQAIHTLRKKEKTLGKHKLPSAIAANGLPFEEWIDNGESSALSSPKTDSPDKIIKVEREIE